MNIVSLAQQRYFYSLNNKSFRIFWISQIFPLIGWWMQSTALSWMVYKLTNSAFMLGLLSLISVLPVGIISLISGVISDRLPRKKLILCTQSILALQALVFFLLFLTNNVQIWHIMLISFIQAAADAMEQPARFSIVSDLVGQKDLSNAIALNSSIIQTARIIGPALAGLIVSMFGEEYCFLITGLGYLGFIIAFNSITINSITSINTTKSFIIKTDIRDGLNYLLRNKTIRTLFLLLIGPIFFAQPFMIILPAFATDFLHVDSLGYGELLSASGIGAICGAFIIAGLRSKRRGLILLVTDLILSFSLILFSFTRFFPLCLLILFLIGVTQIMQQIITNSTIQMLTIKDYQGRLMSFYYIINNGFYRLGGILIGASSSVIGSSYAISLGALLSFVWICCIGIFFTNIRTFEL